MMIKKLVASACVACGVLASSAVHAQDFIYGIGQAGSAAGIFEIDVSAPSGPATATLVYNYSAGGGTGPNCLAYDYDHNKLYWQDQAYGGLHGYDLNVNQHFLFGVTAGLQNNANATYDGSRYLYDETGVPGTLRAVDLNSHFLLPPVYPTTGLNITGYGDIALDPTGTKMFAYGARSGAAQLWSYNYADGSGAALSSTFAIGTGQIQIAFGASGTLYGLGSDGRLYTWDSTYTNIVSNRAVTYNTQNFTVFTDAASGLTAVPEPASMLTLGLGALALLRRKASRG